MTRRPRTLFAVLALTAAVSVGCGSDDEPNDDATTSTAQESDVPTDEATTEDTEATEDPTDEPTSADTGDATAGGICATLDPADVAAATDGQLTEFFVNEPGAVSTASCQFYDADNTTFVVLTEWPIATPADWEAISTRAPGVIQDPVEEPVELGDDAYLVVGGGLTSGSAAETGVLLGDVAYTVSYSNFDDDATAEARETASAVLQLVVAA